MLPAIKISMSALRVLQNVSANAYGQAINVAIQILSVPIFLKILGVELYGEWLVLSAIPTYLALADIGFASVAGNEMAMRIAREDKKGALEVYQSIWLFITVISLISLLALTLTTWYIPLLKNSFISKIRQDEVSILLIILFVHSYLSLQCSVFNAAFRATGAYAFGTFINNTTRLLEWSVGIIALAFGVGLIGMSVASLLARILGTFALFIGLRMKSPWLTLGYDFFRIHVIQRLFKSAIGFMAFPLGLAINVQGMILTVGIFLGPTAVAMFSLYRTIARILVQVVTLFSQAIWPEISSAYGSGKIEKIKTIHRHLSAMTFWLGLLGILMIAACGSTFIEIWTKHTVAHNQSLLLLMLIMVLVNILWQTSWVVLMATNCHHSISIVFILCAAIGVLCSSLLMPNLGLEGAVIALICAEIPIFYFSIKKALMLVDDKWSSYVKAILAPALLRNFRQKCA